ncbi:MAG: PDDEXK nuclease domain-containing protein [Bacteroidales bacterium]|jgi:predicted nuclease of restriction endonuclease-like (RecB) superfamily|nr:PDDEXK nuclease domain-containing protein [Bacteroidales bacterium]
MANNNQYRQWLIDLKQRIRQSQIKAAVKVNTELLRLYWDLGQDIVVRQMESTWGNNFFEQLSHDLRNEFPEIQGFSSTNLKYCKRFYLFYTQDDTIFQQVEDVNRQQLVDDLQNAENENDINRPQVVDDLQNDTSQTIAKSSKTIIGDQAGKNRQSVENENDIIRPQLVDEFRDAEENNNITNRPQAVDDLQSIGDEIESHFVFQIPWGHHREIITKCKSIKEALFYVRKTIDNGWSRAILINFLKADLYAAQGKSLNNFSRLLPEVQSDLAREIIKDPYNFDFLSLTENYKERELEDALTDNITRFLLELGQGFAYLGRQVPVKIGEKERFIDLLFYHTELHCYVVVELKTGDFEAEYAGKLGLYISAINHQRKRDLDNPTIGLIICATKDNVEVQYSLEFINQPIGISEYQLSKFLPDNYKSVLPSINEIENQLKQDIPQ